MLLRGGADYGCAAGVLPLHHLQVRVEAVVAPEGEEPVHSELQKCPGGDERGGAVMRGVRRRQMICCCSESAGAQDGGSSSTHV